MEILEANDNHVRFNLYTGRVPEQYLLKRMGQKRWLARNITPSRSTQKWQNLVGEDRPGMKEIPLEQVNLETVQQIMQPKIDGAHGIVVMEANKAPRVFSYRRAKNETGLIEHTHKMPFFQTVRTPPELGGTVLRGEIFAADSEGKVLPSQQIGSLLNSKVWKSRAKQEEAGTRLGIRTFGIDRYRGKNVSDKPYTAQLEMLREIGEEMKDFKPVPTAITKGEKERMLRRILEDKEPLTREGVVLRDLDTGKILKAKQRPDFDVYIREVVPGRHAGHVGAIRYSRTPKGRILGNVGSGFTHAQRESMLRNPQNYIGRAIKVKSQGQFPSGALRAPVFQEWHLDKGRQPVVEG